MPARPYRARSRPGRGNDTRAGITAAVRELLAEGAFHESTMEQVADRAGIARATLYQHFRSRLELVDAMCDTFAVDPGLRETVELPDAAEALAQTIALSVRLWSTEDAVLAQLYGVAAIDPAARDLVDRQRRDRREVLERLAANLARGGTAAPRALALLLVLTSYETYRELQEAGLDDAAATALLQQTARQLLLPRVVAAS